MPRLFPLVLVACLFAACGPDAPADAPEPETPAIPFRTDATLSFIRADGTPVAEIAVEIADTDSTRERGLMDRDSIPANTGMLFLMPATQVQSFYMANTPRSLDIFFVGPDSVLVNVAKYTRPYDVSPVASDGPARFVVETAAGFADEHGLVPGDRITWTRAASAVPPGDSPAVP